MKLVVHVDGGARGNPGPAAAAAVVFHARRRGPSTRPHEVLGVATNNVAEYRGLLLGLRASAALGANEVEVVNDSELVAKQVNGEYKVEHPDMKPLHAQALAALAAFDRWSVRSVPRAQNADADALVNPPSTPPAERRKSTSERARTRGLRKPAIPADKADMAPVPDRVLERHHRAVPSRPQPQADRRHRRRPRLRRPRVGRGSRRRVARHRAETGTVLV